MDNKAWDKPAFRLRRRLAHHGEIVLSDIDLKVLLALRKLARRGPVTLRALARATGLAGQGNVEKAIARLEPQGLVSLERKHAGTIRPTFSLKVTIE